MKSWIDAFTVAVVEANASAIGTLISTMPEFETKEERIHARALIEEALHLMENEKSKTWETMQKIKQTRTFLTGSLNQNNCEYRG
ncbi:hypothetical protein [Sulfurospirillum barnesii]|uniref:PH domain-containing protein n=1 Tax=Sulfurospirillum barnesii (strain ATCC 700032 / DSM 10660 / SES-3) TaxID=760154 RepID=I3XWT4_SULBS|nr:hypothetical protein [Sulfurospirillum barnesii]AFL68408.1 hypothetical protein Sulba_1112 [Sulfurospirillum barnesii SES-3]